MSDEKIAQKTMDDDEDSPTPMDALNGQCEMCANYEVSLQTMQNEQETLREQLAAAKELYEKYGKELSEERLYRKELEGRFATLNEETEHKIQACLESVTIFEERMELLGKKQEADLTDMGRELDMAKERQLILQRESKTLYEKYQRLLHKNSQKADELREQNIDLPQTVDELTLLALQLREDLISEKAAREHECQELRDELAVAREQMLEMDIRAKENEDQLLIYAQQQQHQLEQQRGGRRHQPYRLDGSSSPSHSAGGSGATAQPILEQSAVDGGTVHADCCPNANCHRLTVELERRLHRSMHERARLQDLLVEQKNKCAQMQSELDTSETVQKDFVQLSQTLQMELEKIRQSESEVRWQDEQDFAHCFGCNNELLPGSETRINCRHCGKIFCSLCSSNKVPSGPSKRLVPVCNLCHMLLSNKDHSLVDRLNINNSSPQPQS